MYSNFARTNGQAKNEIDKHSRAPRTYPFVNDFFSFLEFFLLTTDYPTFIIVLTMNHIAAKPTEELLHYQTARIKDLIEGIIQCCQMQTSFLSQKFRIPQAEIRCLLLFRGERYLTVKGISQKLDVAKSRVTKVINGLQNKGFIDCSDDPRDGRVKLLSLTALGDKKCEEMGEYIWGAHEKLLLELDPEERRSVISSLESLRVGMEAVKKELV